MMDKIPIKTLLDHAKQPFIPYTTAKSVMWDGTDKTLYDVVMEGVPIPEIETEYLPTYRVEDNSRDNPIVWSEQKKGIYFFPDWTLYYKMDANDSVRNIRILDYRVYKMYDYIGPEENKPHFIYFGDTGIRRFNTHTLYNGGYVSDVLIPSKQAASWTIQGSTMFNYLPTCYQTPTQDAHLTTKKYVGSAITEALASYTPTVDLSNYYTKEEIDAELGERDTALNADIMVAINAAGRAEMEVQNKQNKITYGTGDPSGGSNGDVYLKYTA